MSSTTLPSISESGPLKNINRSVDDDQVVTNPLSDTYRPNYNRTRSLSITRTYIRVTQQSLKQTRSSNNLERLNYHPQAIVPNTSPKQQFTPIGSPLCRPTSPDVCGSLEATEEENRLHDNVVNEIFRLTKIIDSKSSIEASLKNARFSHRQFNQNSIQPTQFVKRKLSTGLVRLLGQDNKNGHNNETLSSAPVTTGDKPGRPDIPCIINAKLSNDDYIYATYQLTRDKILKYKQENLRRQISVDQDCTQKREECPTSQDTIPEEDIDGKEQDDLPDRVSAKENDNSRLQQRKLLQPQHKIRDKFTSFFRSGSTSPSSVPLDPNTSNDGSIGQANTLDTHHEAFNDHNYIGSKTETYDNSMAYALPLARKCSLVSEESCSNEPGDN